MSKSILSSVCLFICKTKLKTLTEWTVSGPEGGIAITPVSNTEYHPLLEGGGATGCGITFEWDHKTGNDFNKLWRG
jgi:hypothetical protein